jgi:hypothetical protein
MLKASRKNLAQITRLFEQKEKKNHQQLKSCNTSLSSIKTRPTIVEVYIKNRKFRAKPARLTNQNSQIRLASALKRMHTHR